MWSIAGRLDREVASDKKMLSKKSHNPLVTWINLVTWQGYTSIFKRLVATKLDRMVAYDKEPQT